MRYSEKHLSEILSNHAKWIENKTDEIMSFLARGDEMNIKRSETTIVVDVFCKPCGIDLAFSDIVEAMECAVVHVNETGHSVQLFRKFTDSITVSK